MPVIKFNGQQFALQPGQNRLGGGTITMAGSQQPWRVAGAESVVYQLRQSNGRSLGTLPERCRPGDDAPDRTAETQEPSTSASVPPFLPRVWTRSSNRTERGLATGT